MEKFFSDSRLRYLFRRYSEAIKKEGYNASENRRHGKNSCNKSLKNFYKYTPFERISHADLGKIDVKKYTNE